MDIENLPAVPFITLERASKILDCEIDDILYWNSCSLLTLYVYFESANATLTFKANIDKQQSMELFVKNKCGMRLNKMTRFIGYYSKFSVGRDKFVIDKNEHKPYSISVSGDEYIGMFRYAPPIPILP